MIVTWELLEQKWKEQTSYTYATLASNIKLKLYLIKVKWIKQIFAIVKKKCFSVGKYINNKTPYP